MVKMKPIFKKAIQIFNEPYEDLSWEQRESGEIKNA